MSATKRGAVRQVNDLYETPGWLTQAILPHLEQLLRTTRKPFDWADGSVQVLEPACGKLAIASEIQRQWSGVRLYVSDLVAGSGAGYSWPSTDFLRVTPNPVFDLIITNPPFSLALEFVQQAMHWRRDSNSIVAMLLRLNWLGSQQRAPWLRQHTPAVYVTPRRPAFSTNKQGKVGTDSADYAWMVWPPAGVLPTVLILETEDTVVRSSRKLDPRSAESFSALVQNRRKLAEF